MGIDQKMHARAKHETRENNGNRQTLMKQTSIYANLCLHCCPIFRPPVGSVPLGMVNDAADHAERISVEKVSKITADLHPEISKQLHICMLYIIYIYYPTIGNAIERVNFSTNNLFV